MFTFEQQGYLEGVFCLVSFKFSALMHVSTSGAPPGQSSSWWTLLKQLDPWAVDI